MISFFLLLIDVILVVIGANDRRFMRDIEGIVVAIGILAILGSMTGIGLGIGGAVQQTQNKTSAVLGLVFSGLTLLTLLIFFIAAAAS